MFKVSSTTSPSKRALRLLRARSFTLELLCETVCSMIVEELGLERCSVIYSSGGGFSVLAPNTQKTFAQLRIFQSGLTRGCMNSSERYFTWHLHGRLLPLNLRKDLGPAWMRVHEELGVSKSRKWFERANDVFEPEPPRLTHVSLAGISNGSSTARRNRSVSFLL